METRYALWDEPQPTCPQAAFTAASYNRPRRPREGPWRGISIEPSGKGSFQAVKLQRPARATVCSHSTRDMAATRSIESKHDHNDTQDECLSCCEQSPLLCSCFTYSSLADDRIIIIYQASLSASL